MRAGQNGAQYTRIDAHTKVKIYPPKILTVNTVLIPPS